MIKCHIEIEHIMYECEDCGLIDSADYTISLNDHVESFYYDGHQGDGNFSHDGLHNVHNLYAVLNAFQAEFARNGIIFSDIQIDGKNYIVSWKSNDKLYVVNADSEDSVQSQFFDILKSLGVVVSIQETTDDRTSDAVISDEQWDECYEAELENDCE